MANKQFTDINDLDVQSVNDKAVGTGLNARADYKRYNFTTDAPFEPVRCGCDGIKKYIDKKLTDLTNDVNTNNSELNCQVKHLIHEVHDIHEDVHPRGCGCNPQNKPATKGDISEAVQDIKSHVTEQLESINFDEKFSDLNSQVAAIYDKL